MITKGRPQLYDDNKGNKYMTLWNIGDRQNSSIDKLAVDGGLMAGRVDFNWNFRDKSKIAYQYYLEYMVDGLTEAALFWKMSDTSNLGQGLLEYINGNRKIKVNNDATNHYWMTFDGTKSGPEGQQTNWTNTGITEIGVFYVDMFDWKEVHIPSPSTQEHIHVDMENFNSIEVCVVSKKDVVVCKFRRDLPIVKPIDYSQHYIIGGNTLKMSMTEDDELVVDLVVKGEGGAKIDKLFWRYLDR